MVLPSLKARNNQMTKQFTAQATKTHLSKSTGVLLSGEKVMIADGPKPHQGKFGIGLLEGQSPGPGPDFFQPMGEVELDLWEGN